MPFGRNYPCWRSHVSWVSMSESFGKANSLQGSDWVLACPHPRHLQSESMWLTREMLACLLPEWMSLRWHSWGLRIWNDFVARWPDGSLSVKPFASPKKSCIPDRWCSDSPSLGGKMWLCAGECRLVSSAQEGTEGGRLLFPGQSAAPVWIPTNMESCVHADSKMGLFRGLN